jgi:dimethylargininase
MGMRENLRRTRRDCMGRYPSGMDLDGTAFRAAIVRPPAATYADGLTSSGLGAPHVALALRQHAAYIGALEALGVRVTVLPPVAVHPDATFVEDTAVVTARGAIVARPGAPSRLGEADLMRPELARLLGEVAAIEAPGTLDGGDICQAGRHFLIGVSARTNEAGARQLATWLAARDYEATLVDIRGEATLLHLKSGIAWLGGRDLVVAEPVANRPEFAGFRRLVVPAAEAYAANCVRVNAAVLVAAGFPAAAKLIAAAGYRVVPLEMSEFRKMDGGLSCLSLRLP